METLVDLVKFYVSVYCISTVIVTVAVVYAMNKH